MCRCGQFCSGQQVACLHNRSFDHGKHDLDGLPLLQPAAWHAADRCADAQLTASGIKTGQSLCAGCSLFRICQQTSSVFLTASVISLNVFTYCIRSHIGKSIMIYGTAILYLHKVYIVKFFTIIELYLKRSVVVIRYYSVI